MHEVRRDDDGELLGFVAVDGDAWAPLTVFGAPIAEPTDVDTARDIVSQRGLSVLAERWEFLRDGEWAPCHLVEASPDRVTAMFGDNVADPTTRFTVNAPVGDVLRLRR